MADNYLENHYEEYLKRKAQWEKSGRKSIVTRRDLTDLKEEQSKEAL